MTQVITSTTGTQTKALNILFVAIVGAGILFFSGFVQSTGLHDAAHDMRHATGFPCH
ncbi:MAG: CbtB domain-containing protein [Roseovarius sp.]|uniref:CbtB domain-containing protein n=1 Tax=Roseovarius sp. TaxID=1486281 RepID=UPI00405839FE